MKKGTHPEYGPVVFRDRSAGWTLLTRSTLASSASGGGAQSIEARIDIEGVSYPVIDVDVSSASHPYWTGRGRVLDTEGRVEAFRRRYARHAASSSGDSSGDTSGGEA